MVVDPPSVQRNRTPARQRAICVHHTAIPTSSAGKDVTQATLRFVLCKVARWALEHARQLDEHPPTQGAHAPVRGTATSSSSPLHAVTWLRTSHPSCAGFPRGECNAANSPP
ncbi:hypothetical protein CGC20_22250 [Leishmania donovani]|uniref:Uncharacterized protein n=1 Tax=Leishmania donovani TaxID=5661 RepID=A0A504YAK4_LEIDO|nr:hypothetical protein CGC20_22250 [Leishmania donovani]